MSNEPTLPALARSVLDRNAEARTRESWIQDLREDPATRVVVVRADQSLVSERGTLVTRSPFDVVGEGSWGYLGRSGGLHYVVCVLAETESVDETGGEWASLRVVGGDLSALDAGLFVEAVSLARWFGEARFCPNCGSEAVLTSAGWMRRCPTCEREHFPRMDPAVIVAVTSGDKILLGSNALWQHNRFSCFAGFVEAGESLEFAVHREVAEEAGVDVHSLTYFGSQAWPYPRSLMLGFYAEVDAGDVARPDGEEILEVRWFTRDEVRAAYAGESDVLLPGAASIAHALITTWAGQ